LAAQHHFAVAVPPPSIRITGVVAGADLDVREETADMPMR